MNRICPLYVLVLCVACFMGCATRPPSAMQFMESYKKSSAPQNKKVVNLSGSVIAKFPAVTEWFKNNSAKNKDDDNIFYEEFPEDFSGQLTYSLSHFVTGFDIHVFDLSPFAGVAFDHFGAMAWFDLAGILAEKPGYGLMLIEQFHVGKSYSWGITQHVSHDVFFSPRGSSRDVDYIEVGGGAYVLLRTDRHAVGLDGRYGRKVTDGMSHFALALSFM